MWFFLTKRLRQWLLMTVVLPVVLKLVGVVRRSLESRSGRNRLTRALARVEKLGARP